MPKKTRKVYGRSQAGTVAMSQQGIATRLGLHVNTVQQNEMRALRKIRAAIEAEAGAAGVTVNEWCFGTQTKTEKQTGNVLNQLLRTLSLETAEE